MPQDRDRTRSPIICFLRCLVDHNFYVNMENYEFHGFLAYIIIWKYGRNELEQNGPQKVKELQQFL